MTETAPATTCASCQWFTSISTNGTFGQCRFSAPTHDGWPTVTITNWCGDWDQSCESLLPYEPAGRNPRD